MRAENTKENQGMKRFLVLKIQSPQMLADLPKKGYNAL
jgi:hypothetical protein